MLALLWRLTRGYRLRPWRSPYLRWRIETYWGIEAGRIGFLRFWAFVWTRRRDLLRYARWARTCGAPARNRGRKPAAGPCYTQNAF